MNEAQILDALKQHGLSQEHADRLGKLPPGSILKIITTILQHLLGSGLLGGGTGGAHANFAPGNTLQTVQVWLSVLQAIVKDIEAVLP